MHKRLCWSLMLPGLADGKFNPHSPHPSSLIPIPRPPLPSTNSPVCGLHPTK